MTENETQCRVTFSEELLQVVRHGKETNFEHLLTGDGSWFYDEYHHDLAWASSRATLPTRKAQKIQIKIPGLHCLVDFGHPQSSKLAVRDAKFFRASVLLDIERISGTTRAGRRFKVSTSISIMHQLTTPKGRGKKVPEPKPPRWYIKFVLLMLCPVASSCLAT
jgi:hypothetical protein